MKQKGQIVEILPTSPIYSIDLSSSLSTETDFLSASQKDNILFLMEFW